MGSGISSEFAQVFHRKKKTTKHWKVSPCHPQEPLKMSPGSPILETPRLRWFKPPWPWPDFYPPNCWVVGPLCQLSKKRVTFSLNSPSQKGHKLAELPGSTDFLFKEKKWLEITKHPSIRHSKKLVLKSSRDLSLSLPKGNCSFLITLSVEILNSIKKKSQRLPGHSAGYFGEPPKLPTNKIQSKVWFFTVDFFLSKKWLQLFSVLFFDDVSNTWGGLLQPGQVVFQWISQRILPGGS